jgi:integrase
MHNDRSSPAGQPPRLLDRVRETIRARGYSPRTAEAYCTWVRRFCVFNNLRHPRELGPPEIEAFLSHLANEHHVSASTQNQALAALLFLYVHVLSVPLARLGEFTRAKRPHRVPAVLAQTDVAVVLDRMTSVPALMASLLYGAGLRLLECARMRAKDLDFERLEIVVRDGKGRKDRITMLPERVVDPLRAHLDGVREQHAPLGLNGARSNKRGDPCMCPRCRCHAPPLATSSGNRRTSGSRRCSQTRRRCAIAGALMRAPRRRCALGEGKRGGVWQEGAHDPSFAAPMTG